MAAPIRARRCRASLRPPPGSSICGDACVTRAMPPPKTMSRRRPTTNSRASPLPRAWHAPGSRPSRCPSRRGSPRRWSSRRTSSPSLAADRERVGAGTDVDTAMARADVYNLEDALAQAEYARDQALRALELLLGRYPAAEIATRTDFVGHAARPARGRAAGHAGAPARCHRGRAPRGRGLQSYRRGQGGAAAADHAEPELWRLRE